MVPFQQISRHIQSKAGMKVGVGELGPVSESNRVLGHILRVELQGEYSAIVLNHCLHIAAFACCD